MNRHFRLKLTFTNPFFIVSLLSTTLLLMGCDPGVFLKFEAQTDSAVEGKCLVSSAKKMPSVSSVTRNELFGEEYGECFTVVFNDAVFPIDINSVYDSSSAKRGSICIKSSPEHEATLVGYTGRIGSPHLQLDSTIENEMKLVLNKIREDCSEYSNYSTNSIRCEYRAGTSDLNKCPSDRNK